MPRRGFAPTAPWVRIWKSRALEIGLFVARVTTEPNKTLSFAVADENGAAAGFKQNLSGTADIPILTRRGDALNVHVAEPAGSPATFRAKYSVKVLPASTTLKNTAAYPLFGGLDAQANVAVIANGLNMKVQTVSASGSVTATKTVSTTWSTDVIVEGKYAFVSDAVKGLVVYNIQNPASPQKIAEEWSLGGGWGIAKSGDRVYLAAGLFGIQVYDVSNPLDTTWIDNIMLCDVVERVAVSGNTLVATTLLDGLVVLGVEPGGAELEFGGLEVCTIGG